MPINIEGRQDGVGVIYNCHGDMTMDDFFQAGIGFLAFPEGIKMWRYCIVDPLPSGPCTSTPMTFASLSSRTSALPPSRNRGRFWPSLLQEIWAMASHASGKSSWNRLDGKQ